VSGTTRVFISYRRQDARHVAGRLADRLVERFQVFMDMDTIEPGTDFTDVIRQAVEDCDIFLSVIGAQWMSVKDDQGQRRLEDAGDWVVAETVAALLRNVPVIPVLVDGAAMPSRSELPAELAPLASRQAMTIRHESFSSDVNRLISVIERRVGAAGAEHDPNERQAEAPRSRQLATWSEQADRAAAEGRWSDAVVQLENIRALDANYPDLARRLQVADARRRQLAELYSRAVQAEAAAMSSPNPPPRPPDGPIAAPLYFAPPPNKRSRGARGVSPRDRTGSRAWIIAAVAVVLVAVVVAGVIVFGDRIGTATDDPSTSATPSAAPSALSVSPSPSDITPSPIASASPRGTPGLTTSELRTHIPRDIRATCKDYVPPDGDPLEVKLIGALRCELTEPDAPNQVWYFSYNDNAAMDAAYAPYTKGTFVKGDCKAKGQKMDFTTTEQGKKLPGGVLHCYQSENGDAYFAWTHDFLHIMSFAGDSDLTFAKMKAWWEHAGPYRQP
jgi:TIR domain